MAARRLLLTAVTVVFVLACAMPASAFMADFFEYEASGNATYEAMAIGPEAVYDAASNTTYIAYQGYGLDPYVVAYDHTRSRWTTPVAVGDNPQTGDPHGGPAIALDKQGYVHVFYGAHQGSLFHVKSANPTSTASWDAPSTMIYAGPFGTAAVKATYPQPLVSSDGTITLFYRNSDDLDPFDGNSYTEKGAWLSITSVDGGSNWGSPVVALSSVGGASTGYDNWWYADFDLDASDTIHAAFTSKAPGDQFQRYGLYSLRSQPGTSTWWTVDGSRCDTRTKDYLDTAARIDKAGTSTQINQVVGHRVGTATADPGILYMASNGVPGSYHWRFTRWSGADATWTTPVTITDTDQFFDAADFDVAAGGAITAYLTTGGYPDENALPGEVGYATRGGDITRWSASDASASVWTSLGTLKASPGPWARYNNPQVVKGTGPARLLFSEWDNDYTNYVHKVFLWGPGGFVGREMTAEGVRLGGTNRARTAALVSRQAYPSGCTTVVVAFQGDYPDALCAVPLAHAYRAPVLLVASRTVDADVLAEITRLHAVKAVVVGGTSVVGTPTTGAILTALRGNDAARAKITRIYGKDRFETSTKIAAELRKIRGDSGVLVVASGQSFADALAVSPLAARKNYPVLLTASSFLPTITANSIAAIAPGKVLIIGGSAAVSSAVEAAISVVTPNIERIAGANRFETGARVNEYAFAQGVSMERFVLCSGVDFPDALAGGVLAARFNGPLQLTRPELLPDPTETQITAKRNGVVKWFTLGGLAAVQPSVDTSVAYILYH